MPSSKAKYSYLLKRGASPGSGGTMTTNRDYSVNLSVQQVLSLWVQGTTLQHFTVGKHTTLLLTVQEEEGSVDSVGETEAGVLVDQWNQMSPLSWVNVEVNSSSSSCQGAPLPHEMWYWVFLWCLFSSLFIHGAVGLLMLVMLQRHRRGRLITMVMVSVGFLASLCGGVITSAAVAGVYRVAGKDMAPLEALVLGVGQTSLSVVVSFSRVLATL
ncbi:hypothetical protein INR49_002829 [Caranx melampygus]|nr:hypothetical protein INR49_002829 [Caranx melampygus]